MSPSKNDWDLNNSDTRYSNFSGLGCFDAEASLAPTPKDVLVAVLAETQIVRCNLIGEIFCVIVVGDVVNLWQS